MPLTRCAAHSPPLRRLRRHLSRRARRPSPSRRWRAVPPPPRGEASVPPSIAAKFVVRQSIKTLSYHKVTRHPRACTRLPPRGSCHSAPQGPVT